MIQSGDPMVLSMARPLKHPKTGVYWFRKAVPKNLRALLGKREELRTLRTKDPTEAREAHAAVAAEVEAYWKALRSPAQSLNNREIVALAGVFYVEITSQLSNEPGSEEAWRHWLRIDQEAREAGRLEQWYGETVDKLLRQKALHIDALSDRILTNIPTSIDVIHVEQPWLWPLATKIRQRPEFSSSLLVYGSQNLEAPLKSSILEQYKVNAVHDVVDAVEALEKQAVLEADLTVAVTEDEAGAFPSTALQPS